MLNNRCPRSYSLKNTSRDFRNILTQPRTIQWVFISTSTKNHTTTDLARASFILTLTHWVSHRLRIRFCDRDWCDSIATSHSGTNSTINEELGMGASSFDSIRGAQCRCTIKTCVFIYLVPDDFSELPSPAPEGHFAKFRSSQRSICEWRPHTTDRHSDCAQWKLNVWSDDFRCLSLLTPIDDSSSREHQRTCPSRNKHWTFSILGDGVDAEVPRQLIDATTTMQWHHKVHKWVVRVGWTRKGDRFVQLLMNAREQPAERRNWTSALHVLLEVSALASPRRTGSSLQPLSNRTVPAKQTNLSTNELDQSVRSRNCIRIGPVEKLELHLKK
jgi:hypothetical protein